MDSNDEDFDKFLHKTKIINIKNTNKISSKPKKNTIKIIKKVNDEKMPEKYVKSMIKGWKIKTPTIKKTKKSK